MMKKILLILSFMLSTASYAGTSMPPQHITLVTTGWGGEGIYVITQEGLRAEGCAVARARMNLAHPMLKENLSILLSAFHTNSKVRLYVDGCINSDLHLKAVAIEK